MRWKIVACVLGLAASSLAQEAVLSHNSSLRSGPSSASNLIESLAADTSVTVVSKKPRSGYAKVQTSDGKSGWIWNRNLATVQANEKQPLAEAMNLAGVAPNSRTGDPEIYPNPDLTPGAVDARVTQQNIQSTICKPGYTSTVRPPVSVTNPIKKQTMTAHGFTDAPQDYELDHLISLELGGCPDCVTNLWPEACGDKNHHLKQADPRPPGENILPGAKQKDKVENFLHKQVCAGAISLRDAQRQIAGDWFKVFQQNP